MGSIYYSQVQSSSNSGRGNLERPEEPYPTKYGIKHQLESSSST